METKSEKDILFPELEGDKRVQAIKDNAYKLEEKLVTREFNREQLQEFKEELADESVQLSVYNAELEKIKKEYQAKMKPHQEKIAAVVKNLKLKYSESIEEVALMADHYEGVMREYDLQGNFLNERKLYPHERQMNIVQAKAVNE